MGRGVVGMIVGSALALVLVCSGLVVAGYVWFMRSVQREEQAQMLEARRQEEMAREAELVAARIAEQQARMEAERRAADEAARRAAEGAGEVR